MTREVCEYLPVNIYLRIAIANGLRIEIVKAIAQFLCLVSPFDTLENGTI